MTDKSKSTKPKTKTKVPKLKTVTTTEEYILASQGTVDVICASTGSILTPAGMQTDPLTRLKAPTFHVNYIDPGPLPPLFPGLEKNDKG
jgi:hypothetical protein